LSTHPQFGHVPSYAYINIRTPVYLKSSAQPVTPYLPRTNGNAVSFGQFVWDIYTRSDINASTKFLDPFRTSCRIHGIGRTNADGPRREGHLDSVHVAVGLGRVVSQNWGMKVWLTTAQRQLFMAFHR
jgi:hypothetical protein